MISETRDAEILVTQDEKSTYKVYRSRFYVLFAFSLLAFNQCTIWLTFSPIARSSESYYNISEATVDLLLNWGPIIFIPILPLTSILLNSHNGLRHCVIILAIADFVAAALRVIPLIIDGSQASRASSIALPFVHAGQIINAGCGPLVMAPVSQLSCLWFAPHERTRATTIAIMANNFGATIGFIINPLIVTKPEDMPRILYLHLGLAFVACVLALIYFPAQPPTPPSAAAELLVLHPDDPENQRDWRVFVKDIWQCCQTPSFVILTLAGGLMYGTINAWTGLFDVLLEPENYTEEQAGWFGFAQSLAGIIGAVLLGHIADTPRFQHSLKTLVLICFFLCLLGIIWFQLSVHSLFYDKPILSSTVVTIGLSTGVAGLFSGSAAPLIYEALAEIMYPIPESLSASILVQLMNIVSLIFLFVAPNRDKLVNFIVVVVAVACIGMVLATRFTYRRRDEDEKRRLEKENNSMVNGSGQINGTICTVAVNGTGETFLQKEFL